jgi:hypothetical protein
MKKLLLTTLALVAVLCVNAQTVIFHETFNQLTTSIVDNALTSGSTDEPDWLPGGGQGTMKGIEGGIFQMTGGRFETRKMDLTGENTLTIRFRFAGITGTNAHKRFQIDVDKTGTSGMGTTFNPYFDEFDGGSLNTEFQTMQFLVTGTAASYVHFRAESELIIEFDDIKVTTGAPASVPSTNNVKEILSTRTFDVLGKEVPAETKGLVFVKTLYKDGTTSAQKIYRK